MDEVVRTAEVLGRHQYARARRPAGDKSAGNRDQDRPMGTGTRLAKVSRKSKSTEGGVEGGWANKKEDLSKIT